MSAQQDSRQRVTIDPYYKGNVFERDQAYYSQMLAGTRRSGSLRNSQRQASLQRSNLNDRQRNPSPPPNATVVQATRVETEYRNSEYQRGTQTVRNSQYVSVDYNRGGNTQTIQNSQAMKTNYSLKEQLEGLISGHTEFGHSANVVKLSHYNFNQNDTAKIKEQENEIRRLEVLIEANKEKLSNFKKAGEELSLRMVNIQSIDKEIYKTLQGSVNRDKQLLERASSALARGERREDVAKLLQQILA